MLDNTLELITRSNMTKERYVLYTTIDQLSETEIKPAQHLLNKMRYPKGSQKGQILSPYLQDKALLFIEDSLYKPANKLLKDTNEDLHKLKETNEDLHRKVQKLDHQNFNFKFLVYLIIMILSYLL